ncbi:MAG TPA: hypothetical protein VLH75_15855 [Longimicrobiales bacterium]|nr:hypothetical protein [Longimicrobiales bacterium]
MGDSGRRYTEKEFALILRKAAELQERPGEPGAMEGGMTLGEISTIAREVGLDPAVVARVASEMDQPPSTGLAHVLGGSARQRMEASVPGVLGAGSYPRVASALREATTIHGEVRESLGSLEWKASDDVTSLSVTVTPGSGGTRIVVIADRRGAQAVTWLVPPLLALLATGITGAVIEPSTVSGGVALGVGLLGAGLITARTIWAVSTRRFAGRMARLLERVRGEVAAASRPEEGDDQQERGLVP